jgi:hypothetical protein
MKTKSLKIILIIISSAILLESISSVYTGAIMRYDYSIFNKIACEIQPWHDYRPVRVVRMTDMNDGYYCVTQEEYDNDVAG